MTTVETVRGPVDVAALGPTLMHEHIFVLDPAALANYAHAWGESYWDEEARIADAIQKLQRLRDGGIHTLVDPSVPGLGRHIPRIQRINAEVDLNIVVATGVYQFLELPSFLAYRSDDVDHRALRARDPRGHRRHRRQGGIPQVRRRAARARSATFRGSSRRSQPRSIETGAPVMVHTNAVAQTGLLALAGTDRTRASSRRAS